MATAKVITANGVIVSLEIKGRFGKKSFVLEGDELTEFSEYLKNENNLAKEFTKLENGSGDKITINNRELRSLADKLNGTRKPLESPTEATKSMASEIPPPEPLKPVVSTKQSVVPKPNPVQTSKLQVISIMNAKIEWQACIVCPNCKTKYNLDIKINAVVPDQFAAQCECGQILFLQK